MAAMALVPSGAIAAGPYKVVEAVNFVLPFKATLQALDAAINDAVPTLPGPLLHLAGITIGFTALARLAMRRFG
jgi:ABC-2 type transport system permease protein